MEKGRHGWTFHYSANEVLAAAQKKVEYHKERIAFWQKESVMAEAELRQKGVEFKDYDVTGGKRLEVKTDPGLLRRYEEARSKMEMHELSLKEYERYARALEHEIEIYEKQDSFVDVNIPELLELYISDLEYFDL